MSDNPLVSVIIPVYNVEPYLERCVDSIRSQTLENLEIILVDDGSPDKCPEICDNYKIKDTRIKVIHKKNEGLGLARNSGLNIATGKWVCFVDSDDFIHKDSLKTCVDIGEDTGVDQIRFTFTQFLEDDNIDISDKLCNYRAIVHKGYNEKLLPLLNYMANTNNQPNAHASAWGAIYRREAIESSGVRFHSERELISEDFAFNLEFAAKSGAIAYTSYPFYFYRVNLNSLSKMYQADRLERCIVFSKYLESKLEELKIPDAQFIAASNLIGNLRLHLRHIFASNFPNEEKRRLHNEAVNNRHIRTIHDKGLYKRLPLKQRIAFVFRKSYLISRILSDARLWIRSVLGQ